MVGDECGDRKNDPQSQPMDPSPDHPANLHGHHEGPACEERPEHHMHGQGVPCSMLPPGIHRGTPGRIHENAHRGSQGQHEYARHQQQRPVPPALRRSAELHEHRRNPSANAPDLFRPSANPFGKTREKRPPLPRHDGEQHDRGEHARPRDEDEQQAPSEPETVGSLPFEPRPLQPASFRHPSSDLVFHAVAFGVQPGTVPAKPGLAVREFSLPPLDASTTLFPCGAFPLPSIGFVQLPAGLVELGKLPPEPLIA